MNFLEKEKKVESRVEKAINDEKYAVVKNTIKIGKNRIDISALSPEQLIRVIKILTLKLLGLTAISISVSVILYFLTY